MRLGFAAWVLCWALSGSALAAPMKVAMPGLSAVNVDEKLAGFFNEQLAQRLEERGLSVVTAKDVATLLGLERQKQLLTCGEDNSSCLAEISNALGVDAVVTGDLAKIGQRYQLSIKALASGTGKRLGAFNDGVDSEEGLVELARTAADKLAQSLGGSAPAPKKSFAWLPLAGGGVLVAGGIVTNVMARSVANDIATNTTSYRDALLKKQNGETLQTVSFVLGGVGLAALGVGAYLAFSGAEHATSVEPTALLLPGGAGVALSGVWP